MRLKRAWAGQIRWFAFMIYILMLRDTGLNMQKLHLLCALSAFGKSAGDTILDLVLNLLVLGLSDPLLNGLGAPDRIIGNYGISLLMNLLVSCLVLLFLFPLLLLHASLCDPVKYRVCSGLGALEPARPLFAHFGSERGLPLEPSKEPLCAHYPFSECTELLPVCLVGGLFLEVNIRDLLQVALKLLGEPVTQQLRGGAHFLFHDKLVFFMLGLGLGSLPGELSL